MFQKDRLPQQARVGWLITHGSQDGIQASATVVFNRPQTTTGETISTWFSEPSWEWRLPAALGIGILINLIITVARLRSRRLREAALKDLEHSHAILILTGAQALQALLPLIFAFLVIPMLGLPNDVVGFFERFTLVLVIIFVGIDTLRTLRLVEAKIAHRARLRSGGEERQVRAVSSDV